MVDIHLLHKHFLYNNFYVKHYNMFPLFGHNILKRLLPNVFGSKIIGENWKLVLFIGLSNLKAMVYFFNRWLFLMLIVFLKIKGYLCTQHNTFWFRQREEEIKSKLLVFFFFAVFNLFFLLYITQCLSVCTIM